MTPKVTLVSSFLLGPLCFCTFLSCISTGFLFSILNHLSFLLAQTHTLLMSSSSESDSSKERDELGEVSPSPPTELISSLTSLLSSIQVQPQPNLQPITSNQIIIPTDNITNIITGVEKHSKALTTEYAAKQKELNEVYKKLLHDQRLLKSL